MLIANYFIKNNQPVPVSVLLYTNAEVAPGKM
jgi:hypothetical protein